jgi:hypothetical protein
MALFGLIDLTLVFGVLLYRTTDRLTKTILIGLWSITAVVTTVGVPL